MDELDDPEDLKLLVRILRLLRGWDQAELAAAAGLDASSISHYETGRTLPPRRTLERLAVAVGLPMSFVEGSLLPVLNAARTMASPAPVSAESDSLVEECATELGRALAAVTRLTMTAFLGRLDGAGRKPEP
jgi:transcriptional regulator with XRE-family HTH domain